MKIVIIKAGVFSHMSDIKSRKEGERNELCTSIV